MPVAGPQSHLAWSILKKEWYYITPLVIITVLMLFGYSAGFAAVVGILSSIGVSFFKKETRMTPVRFIEASRLGTESSLKNGWNHWYHHFHVNLQRIDPYFCRHCY